MATAATAAEVAVVFEEEEPRGDCPRPPPPTTLLRAIAVVVKCVGGRGKVPMDWNRGGRGENSSGIVNSSSVPRLLDTLLPAEVSFAAGVSLPPLPPLLLLSTPTFPPPPFSSSWSILSLAPAMSAAKRRAVLSAPGVAAAPVAAPVAVAATDTDALGDLGV